MTVDASRHRRLRALFDDALILEPSQRATFLERACTGDGDLRAGVARLLAAHDGADSFLEHLPRWAGRPDDVAFAGTERFQVIRLLGRGGMGVVYEVHDHQRDEVVALKTLRGSGAVDLYRLKREFRSLADVAHPNIVCLHELVVTDEHAFFTMELVRGVHFIDYVRGTDRAVCSVERLRSALRQLTAGLTMLHQRGMLHRDVKPSNVLVRPDGRTVLLDFGLVAETGPRVRDAVDGGTPAYMAPEEAGGAVPSIAADWYGVGVTLYEALTGRLPFEGTPAAVLRDKQIADPLAPRDIAPDLPEELSSLCLRLLDRDPVRRAHADTVLQVLASAPLPGQASPLTPVFVGRRVELDLLDAAARDVARGNARTVSILGPSGIGKSAVIRQFLTEVNAAAGTVVLAGRCYENESIPYKGLDGVVDELSRYVAALPADAPGAALPDGIRDLARVFPVLRRVSAIATAAEIGGGAADPVQLRRRAVAALRAWFARIASRNRLIIWIDDLQWADVDSMQLLEELLTPPSPPAMLTLLSFRSEDVEGRSFLRAWIDHDARDGHRIVRLGPLSDAESRGLVEALIPPDAPLAAADRQRLTREAGGSPFVLEQIALYATDAATAVVTDPTLAGMVDTRLAALAAPARRFLETLAICGRPTATDVVFEASDIDADRGSLLVTLRASHLIRAAGASNRVEPYHDRIREALTSRLTVDGTRAIHARLAAALVARGSDDCEALFEHHFGAGDLDRAAVQAGRAAEKAAAALAFDQAATFYQRAIDLAAASAMVSGWTRQLAVALTNAGRPAEAAEAYVQAAVDASPAEQIGLNRAAAEQFLIGGHIDRGLGLLRQVLERLGLGFAPNPRVAAVRLVARRIRLWWRGTRFRERPASDVAPDVLLKLDACWAAGTGLALVDIVSASDFLAQHLHLALNAGEPSRIARGLAIEYAARSSDWTFRSSARRLEALSARLSAQVDTPQALAMQLLAESIAACATGQWNRAQHTSERALAILREQCVGVTWEMTIAQNMFLWSLMYRGQLGELSHLVPTLLEDARRRGNLYLVTELVTRSNFVWLAADDADTGEREVEATMRQWSRKGFHRQHYSAMLARMQTALYRGDPYLAWRVLDDNKAPWRASMLMQVQALRVEYHYMRGRCATAIAVVDADRRRWLSIARTYARRIAAERMHWSDPIAHLIEGGIAAAAGDRDAAARTLGSAVVQFDAADMQLYANVARIRLADHVDDAPGAALRRQAGAWMAAQGIKDPARFTRMFAPDVSPVPQSRGNQAQPGQ